MKKLIVITVLAACMPLSLTAKETGSSILAYLHGYRSEVQGQSAQALSSYKEALRFDPDSSSIRGELAFFYAKKGDMKEAESLLKEAIELQPANRNALMLLAGIYSSKGLHPQAKQLYEKCISMNSEDTEAYMHLGTVYVAEKRYADAIGIYEKILSYDNENLLALYYTGRLHAEMKNVEKAREYFTMALSVRPNFEPALLDSGILSEIEGNFKEALEYYEKLLAFDPENKKARTKIAAIFVKQKEYDKAIHAYEEISELDKEDTSVRVLIGVLYLEQDRFDDAIREFNLFLVSKPENNMARLYLATAWKEKGDTKKALEELLKIDPKSEEFLAALKEATFIHLKNRSFDDGIALIEKHLPVSQHKPELYLLLSVIYEEKEDYKIALDTIENGRKLAPNNIDILYQAGMLREKNGEPDKAMAIMEELLKINPDYPNALNYIGYTWADKGIRLDEAEAYIKKALAKKPDDGYIMDSLGWVYYKKGDYRAALDQLLKASAILSDDPAIFEHLGDVYAALKEHQKAIAAYKESIRTEKDEKKKRAVAEKIKAINEKR